VRRWRYGTGHERSEQVSIPHELLDRASGLSRKQNAVQRQCERIIRCQPISRNFLSGESRGHAGSRFSTDFVDFRNVLRIQTVALPVHVIHESATRHHDRQSLFPAKPHDVRNVQ